MTVSSARAYTVAVFAALVGAVSLSLFGVFLVWGPFISAQLDVGQSGGLVLDGLLCLAFFVQHSAMIRKGFRTRLQGLVPPHFHGAVYTIASGAVLLALVLWWQESTRVLVELQGAAKWLLRCLIPLAMWILVSGVRALGSFDAFGIHPIIALVKHKRELHLPLTVRGAYRWVRHPLYLAMLMVMWSYPTMTTDRLLFNVLWTVWVVTGTKLEERDMVATFGAAYRDYQRKVPMIVPWKIPGPRSAIDTE